MKVILKNSREQHSLSLGKVYRVIGIEADDYRIIDDEGEPFLFSPKYFNIIESLEPKEWIVEYGEDKEKYAYPKEMNRVGFFEDYFDDDEKTRKIFWEYVRKKGWQ